MSELFPLKLNAVNNLSDARYAAAAGIAYIGFCFDYTHAQYVPPVKAKEMMDWISGSHLVAEFGNQPLAEILDISKLLDVDIVEVNNGLLPDELKKIEKSVIKKINIDAWNETQLISEMQAYSSVVDAFHVFSAQGHNPYSQSFWQKRCAEFKIFWGLNVEKDTVKQWVEQIKPFALTVQGGIEEAPGVKDFDEIAEWIERLTSD